MIARVRDLNNSLNLRIQAFKAGGTQYCLNVWKGLTLDPEILESISGLRVDFSDTDTIDHQMNPHYLSLDQIEFANQEIG